MSGEAHVRHDYIVGGDAVGRDEEDGIVSKGIDITDFATGDEREGAVEIGEG